MLIDHIQREFDRDAPHGEPGHRRLYRVLRESILADALLPGTRLPSSRHLAGELGIARNTVIHAYEQLTEEGYIATEVGSGTFVADTTLDRPATATTRDERHGHVALPGLSSRGDALVHAAGSSSHQWGAFMPGVPEVRLFPARTWARLHNRLLRKPAPELLTYAVGAGYAPLRAALADYLRTSRAVHCEPEQIIVTAGIHPSLQLIGQLLCDPGDSALVEDPGYWGVRSVLNAVGVHTLAAPVDEEGLCFLPPFASRPRANGDEGQARPPRLIVVSPSHQYPLGMVMSLARRRQLLATAQATDAWVVEDDYDSEFRYGSRPLPSLQGMDDDGRVLYMGTFSKALFPGLRVGYLVVPPALAHAFSTGLAEMFRGGNTLAQAVLADFITEGHFVSHIRRMRELYAQRRESLLAAIKDQFGGTLPVRDGAAGLHLVLTLPPGTDDRAVVGEAFARGILTRPLSMYYQRDAQRQPGLLLGYGHVDAASIARHFAVLAQAIRAAGLKA